jgi:hypothetical protein
LCRSLLFFSSREKMVPLAYHKADHLFTARETERSPRADYQTGPGLLLFAATTTSAATATAAAAAATASSAWRGPDADHNVQYVVVEVG